MAVLDADFAKTIGARARSAFQANRRLAILGGGAAAVALIAVTLLWSGDPDYSVLYAGLSGAQGGLALAELQKLNIPYRIAEGGRVIMVPTAQLGQARLQLAAHGVPKTEGDAWGLLDNEALGVSPFVEQVHYVRGLEANLSHTVGELDGVVSAQVTLALPKRSGFLADEPKPSASVLLRLATGARMSSAQIAGVVGLVASSVPGLEPENVTVVDQDGKVLNAQHADGLQEIPAQLAIVEQINTRYERLIDDLLAPVVGQGNFRISVDTDIDFSQSKQSLVRYGEGHILSQDQTIHEGGGGEAPSGIPGALSNRPPVNPVVVAPANQAAPTEAAVSAKPAPPPRDTHAVTNYDIDKTEQFLQDPAWKLHAVSVAVLLNNATGARIPAERLKSIKTLVESVIGVGARHEVTVVDLPFNQSTAGAPKLAATWWKEPWIESVARNGVLVLAGLLMLFGGVFPLLRWLRARPASVLAAAVPPGGMARTAGVAATPRPGTLAAPVANESGLDFSGVGADAFTVDVDAVRKIVANDPGRTAQVIKEWLNRGTPGNQRK